MYTAASLALMVALVCVPAHSEDAARLLSDSLAPVVLTASAGMWAFGGDCERATGRRCADGLLATAALVAGLKSLTDQPRPCDPQATDGFPSGHAALAFCTASIMADREPGVSGLAYLWAAGMGWSRVKLRRHDITQVLAGAALGYLVGRESVSGEGVFGGLIVPESDCNALAPCPSTHSARPSGLPLLTVTW